MFTVKSQDASDESSDEENAFNIDLDIKVGCYVVVELKTVAAIKKLFVGVVIERNNVHNDTLYMVNFMTKKKSFFVFPNLDDISEVENNEIKCILNTPIVNKRGQYVFDSSIDKYNIE